MIVFSNWAMLTTLGGVFGVLFYTLLYCIFKAVDNLFGINKRREL